MQLLRVSTLLLLGILVTLSSTMGQSVNLSSASLTVNSLNDGAFPSRVAITVPGTAVLDFQADSQTPYALFAGRFEADGMNFGSAGFLNLSDDGFLVVLNGFDRMSALDLGAVTDIAGQAQLVFPATFAGLDIYLQGVVTDATASFSVRLTGTTRMSTVAADETLLFFENEDDSKFVALATPVEFGGTMWSGLFVNANGNVTFGFADPSDQPSASGMTSGPPRVALCWRDLDPRYDGRVTVREDASGVLVSYLDIPVIDPISGETQPDTLSGSIHFIGNGEVDLALVRSPQGEQLIGLTPIAGLGIGDSRNLSTSMPIAVGASDSCFELVPAGRTFDLTQSILQYRHDVAGSGFSLDADAIPLQILDLSPSKGPVVGLASMLIRGTGFEAGATVSVGGVMALTVIHRSADEILIITPSGALGFADVVVSQSGGALTTAPAAYEYIPVQALGGSLPLLAGQSIEILFDLGFTFPMFGEFQDSLCINANGTITFGEADAQGTPSASAMNAGLPRIAPMWQDWQWGPNSLAAIHMTPFFLTVAFVDVESSPSGTPVSFLVKLSHHGEMFFEFFGAPPATDLVLSGISPGNNLSSLSTEIDIDAFSGPSMPFDSLFEVFSPTNAFDLNSTAWDLLPLIDASPEYTSQTNP